MSFQYFTKQWKCVYCQYTHSGIRVWQTQAKCKFEKWTLFLKHNSPDLKADLSKHANKSIKSTIHKCVVNDIPVTNPTQYTKLAKSIVKTEIRPLLEIPISRNFRESSPPSIWTTCAQPAHQKMPAWTLPLEALEAARAAGQDDVSSAKLPHSFWYVQCI